MLIRKAGIEDACQCADIVYASELGRHYFPTREAVLAEVEEGILSDEFYVSLPGESYRGGVNRDEILGFVWYQMKGAFRHFPYLHMIVVREGLRGKGIGSGLMHFLEDEVLKKGENHMRNRVFLTVADFNPSAERFYSERGYVKICGIPELFRKGITENLMMKTVAAV